MTKSQAKEFVKLNPGAWAVNANGARISQDKVVQAGCHFDRAFYREVVSWLDSAFYGNPDDGWSIELPS